MNRATAETLSQFPELRPNLKFVGSFQERNKFFTKTIVDRRVAQIRASGREPGDREVAGLKRAARRAVGKTSSRDYEHSTYHADVAGITINTAHGKRPERMKQMLERDVKVGHHPPNTDSIKAVVDHDRGHQIDDLLQFATRRSILDAELLKIVTPFSVDDVKTGVSEYATKNFKELIAESWSEYRNSPSPRPIAKQIGEFNENRQRNRQATP